MCITHLKNSMIMLFFFTLVIVLLGCTGQESESKQENESKVDTEEAINNNEDDEEGEDNRDKENFNEEDSDPLKNLIERAPEEPTTFDEIISYPVGPLAGNGDITGEEPIMEIEEKAAFVKEVLPSIEEEENEEYIDQWWRAFRYIFSEEYPDPRQILEEINFTHFGNAELEDDRFQFKDQVNVLLILDVSGSMANEVNGKSMLEMAKESILNFSSDLPEEANVGVRVYGHEGSNKRETQEKSCQATELIYDFQPSNTTDIEAVLEPLAPTGWTPIGLSLEKAKEDFELFPGENNTNLVYIVSDGVETCEGDPVAAAQELAESDIQSIVNVIGFNVGIEGQAQLREIAETGGGIYTNAGDEEELKEALGQGEALIKRWKDWKNGERFNVYEQREEQKLALLKERSSWYNLIEDEASNHRMVLRHLFHEENYISRTAYDYMYSKQWDKRDFYFEIRDTEIEELKEEVEKNYETQLEKINEEYEETVNDD
ncbi:VWA domain-containing protein [Gracilibacillus xinjiangensis]|uniref:VWA domain-containing protein n=1 Tax=Gracilibacillus xinjiangensis TaxID=1193282 RepID=A0ABV8WUI7_9BACI